jgi:peptide deformylase
MTDKLDIVLYPDDGLRDVCAPIEAMNDRYDRLIDEMFYTMYDAPGIGLAAPQIAVQERLIVLDVSDNQDQPIALINPEVVQAKGEITYEEGCLSLPGVYAKVKRPAHVLVRGLNRDGEPVELEADDLLAICLQHEIDHLNGKLFVDHLSQLKRNRALQKYRKEMAE